MCFRSNPASILAIHSRLKNLDPGVRAGNRRPGAGLRILFANARTFQTEFSYSARNLSLISSRGHLRVVHFLLPCGGSDLLESWSYCGRVAQLGEHLLCKQGVTGSIPVTSTIFFQWLMDAFRRFILSAVGKIVADVSVSLPCSSRTRESRDPCRRTLRARALEASTFDQLSRVRGLFGAERLCSPQLRERPDYLLVA